jgi:hypothetical protein
MHHEPAIHFVTMPCGTYLRGDRLSRAGATVLRVTHGHENALYDHFGRPSFDLKFRPSACGGEILQRRRVTMTEQAPGGLGLSENPVVPHPGPLSLSENPVVPHPGPFSLSEHPVVPHPGPLSLSENPVVPHPGPLSLSENPVVPHPGPFSLSENPVVPHPSPEVWPTGGADPFF